MFWKVVINIALSCGCEVNAPPPTACAGPNAHNRVWLPWFAIFQHWKWSFLPSLAFIQSTQERPSLPSFNTDTDLQHTVCNQKISATTQSYWGLGWVMILRSCWHKGKKKISISIYLYLDIYCPKTVLQQECKLLQSRQTVTNSEPDYCYILWTPYVKLPYLTKENNCKHYVSSTIMPVSHNRTTCKQPLV